MRDNREMTSCTPGRAKHSGLEAQAHRCQAKHGSLSIGMIGSAVKGGECGGYLSGTGPGTERGSEKNDHHNVFNSMWLIMKQSQAENR